MAEEAMDLRHADVLAWSRPKSQAAKLQSLCSSYDKVFRTSLNDAGFPLARKVSDVTDLAIVDRVLGVVVAPTINGICRETWEDWFSRIRFVNGEYVAVFRARLSPKEIWRVVSIAHQLYEGISLGSKTIRYWLLLWYLRHFGHSSWLASWLIRWASCWHMVSSGDFVASVYREVLKDGVKMHALALASEGFVLPADVVLHPELICVGLIEENPFV